MAGFPRLFRQFIWRSLVGAKLRAVLVVVGIALGMAVVTAIRLANISVTESFRSAVDAVGGSASLRVTGRSGTLDERLVRELFWLEHIGRVSPVVETYAMLAETPVASPTGTGLPRGEVLYVLGVDVLRDVPLRKYRLLSLDRGPQDPTARELLDVLLDDRAVILTERFARRAGYRVGQTIHLAFGSRRLAFTVRGLLRDEGPARTLNGNFALMDIAAAQWAADCLGRIDYLDIQLPADADVDDAARVIGNRLPAALTVEHPGDRASRTETMIAAFQFNLTALGSVALLVGLFLVYNAVSVSVATRREEIGVLRAVGASRRMVLLLFVSEALLLALVGTALGLALGQWLSRAAVRATAQTVETFYIAAVAESTAETSRLSWAEGLTLSAAALVLAAVAALPPAWSATAVDPIEVLRGVPNAARRGQFARWQRWAAAAAFAVGLLCTRAGPVGGRPVLGFVAELLFMLGAALLTPTILRVFCRALTTAVGWLAVWQQEARLAAANLAASVSQTAVSVAALAMSLSMMIAIGVMVGSFRGTVVYWLDAVLTADLAVKPVMNTSALSTGTLDAELVAAIRGDPDVRGICSYSSRLAPYADRRIRVDSTDLAAYLRLGRILFKQPDAAKARVERALVDERPFVLVSESFALQYEKRPGDEVAVATPRGEYRFPVVAVYYDYSSNQGTLLFDDAVYRAHFDDEVTVRSPIGLSVFLRPGADPEQVRERLVRTVGQQQSLYIVTNRQVRGEALRIFDSTFAITYALQSIAMLIAGAGVVATLVRLIFDRRHEIALLSLVGATPGQLQRMIVLEAVLIGGISQGIGIAVGLVLSVVLIFVINVQSFGWTIQFAVPWGFLIQSTIAVMIASAVCGLYPARRAAGLDALSTLRDR